MPRLASATVVFTTNGDDKDWDTLLSVWVEDNRGRSLAVAGGFNESPQDRFPDNSVKTINLDVNPTELDPVDFDGGLVAVKIEPVGNDTWNFSLQLRLHFTIGPDLVQDFGPTSLTQSSPTVSWRLNFPVSPTPTLKQMQAWIDPKPVPMNVDVLVQVHAIDAQSSSPIIGDVVVDQQNAGQTNTPFHYVFHKRIITSPGGPLHEVIYPTVVVHSPGYQDGDVDLGYN